MMFMQKDLGLESVVTEENHFIENVPYVFQIIYFFLNRKGRGSHCSWYEL